MALPPLPRMLEDAVAPQLIAATAISDGLLCPLTAAARDAREASRLPPRNLALLGTVAHHAAENLRRGRWGPAKTPTTAASFLYELAVTQLDEQLRNDAQCAPRAPIRSAVGRNNFLRHLEKLREAFRHTTVRRHNEPPEPLPNVLAPRYAKLEPESRNAPILPGIEVYARNESIRLHGRIDFLRVTRDHLELIEFKSGRIIDDNDRVLIQHKRQLGLYALILEPHFPQRKIQLFVESDRRYEIPWNDRVRAELTTELNSLLALLPSGRAVKSRDIAKPGEHCRRCAIRPCCPAYRDFAEAAWSKGQPGHSMPIDTWGTIDAIEEHAGQTALRMTDAARRRVRVLGVGSARFANLAVADSVAMFDLKSHVSPPRHARWAAPNAFYVDPVIAGTECATEAFAFHDSQTL